MPMKAEIKGIFIALISATGAILYPLSLSLLLPIFMYTIVLEKEERLLEMMKMNGMKMRNYWIIHYLFNFLIYCIMAVVFEVFGYLVVDMPFFTETDTLLIVTITFLKINY